MMNIYENANEGYLNENYEECQTIEKRKKEIS